MSALRSAILSATMLSASPALAQTTATSPPTEPAAPVTTTLQPVALPNLLDRPRDFGAQTSITDPSVEFPEIRARYRAEDERRFPLDIGGTTSRTEIRTSTFSHRQYTWSYEMMGQEINGYSIKTSFTDATGHRARYTEIGISHPLTDDNRWNLRVAGARYSGQTGPERIGTGVAASVQYRIVF